MSVERCARQNARAGEAADACEQQRRGGSCYFFGQCVCHIRNARSRTSAARAPVGAGVEELIGCVRVSVMSCAAALKCDANRLAADPRAQNTPPPPFSTKNTHLQN